MSKLLRLNPGSQEDAVACPFREVLYSGSRGPGKSYALISSYMQGVGIGLGKSYVGYIIRKQYKELTHIRRECHSLFQKLYGRRYKYNTSNDQFTLPKGEILSLIHTHKKDDYLKFHGHQVAFLGFDELTSFPLEEVYTQMKSICRSTIKGMPLKIFSTTNSIGPGHSWVKDYFKIDQVQPGTEIKNEYGLSRITLHGSIIENPHIIKNDPYYLNYLKSIKDPNLRKSWLYGSWDILSGGALSDLWFPSYQLTDAFLIPRGWKIYRNMDFGSSAPYAVLWIAESDGTSFIRNGETINTLSGDVFCISELYGYGGKPNVGTKESPSQIKQKIIEKEKLILKYHLHERIYAGVADSSIYSKDRGAAEASVADMFKPIDFQKSAKGPGSRVQGLVSLREHLAGTVPEINSIREEKGIFFFNNCEHTIRTLPILERDENNLEDVETDGEDHCYDTIRYFLSMKKQHGKIQYGSF